MTTLSFSKPIPEKLQYRMGLPSQPAGYFLACLLAWASISVALAEDYSCEETGETHIWISPLNPKANRQVKIMTYPRTAP